MRGIDLDIPGGQVAGLIGKSGSGIVTHDQQIMHRVDQVYLMDEGRLQGGSSEDMYFTRFRNARRRGHHEEPGS